MSVISRLFCCLSDQSDQKTREPLLAEDHSSDSDQHSSTSLGSNSPPQTPDSAYGDGKTCKGTTTETSPIKYSTPMIPPDHYA